MPTMRLKPFSYKKFKEIYSEVPRLTVEVILKINDGVVLLKRIEKSWKGKWHIPGGTVFYKETLEEAVKRIAKEELDIEVKINKLVGCIEYPSEEKERGFGWSVGIAFLCELVAKTDLTFEEKNIQIFQKLPKNIIEEQRTVLTSVLV